VLLHYALLSDSLTRFRQRLWNWLGFGLMCGGFEREQLAHRFLDLRNPIWTLQDFTRLGTVCRAHDSVLLHQIDKMRCTAITDAQPPLQQGSGSLAELHQPNRTAS